MIASHSWLNYDSVISALESWNVISIDGIMWLNCFEECQELWRGCIRHEDDECYGFVALMQIFTVTCGVWREGSWRYISNSRWLWNQWRWRKPPSNQQESLSSACHTATTLCHDAQVSYSCYHPCHDAEVRYSCYHPCHDLHWTTCSSRLLVVGTVVGTATC